MNSVQKPIARQDNIVMQNLKTETLVYDLNSNKAFCLNETSTEVWHLCDGRHTVSEISDELSKKMKALVSKEFVLLALAQFEQDGLLEENERLTSELSGLSRRDVIKKVGFASVIALPLISSIVAPEAIMAQSGMLAANGDACTPINDTLCQSNNCLNVGAGNGRCCDAGSTQANPPTYNICTTDPDANAFSFRCCSGNASPAGGAPCPVGETRYVCDPY